jgi:hypothetical protein
MHAGPDGTTREGETMAMQVYEVCGKIGRAAIKGVSARDSEDGQEYWCVEVYGHRQGIWESLGTVVAFATSRDAARQAAVDVGLGGVPLLGSPEHSLDGHLRGRYYAFETTGVAAC